MAVGHGSIPHVRQEQTDGERGGEADGNRARLRPRRIGDGRPPLPQLASLEVVIRAPGRRDPLPGRGYGGGIGTEAIGEIGVPPSAPHIPPHLVGEGGDDPETAAPVATSHEWRSIIGPGLSHAAIGVVG
jgi:hypothetical protein